MNNRSCKIIPWMMLFLSFHLCSLSSKLNRFYVSTRNTNCAFWSQLTYLERKKKRLQNARGTRGLMKQTGEMMTKSNEHCDLKHPAFEKEEHLEGFLSQLPSEVSWYQVCDSTTNFLLSPGSAVGLGDLIRYILYCINAGSS